MSRAFILFVLFSLLGMPSALAAEGLAMHGDPLYPADFQAFGYVNPAAPKGGTLHLAASGSFDSLNPFIVRGIPPLGLNTGTLSLVFESLMTRGWDEPFTLYPLLARGYEMGEDRSSIVFHLDPAARFSDQTAVTADDVLFSFRTLRDKGRPNHRTFYRRVAEARKIDPWTVAFSFKPLPNGGYDRELPLLMGLMPILPAHEWEGRVFDETTLRIPVGSGPYRVESVEPGRNMTYRRNPDYWGRDMPSRRGSYNFDAIRIDFYRDDSVSLQAFKAGAYDLRQEMDPNRWATAYDVPAVRDGRIHLESFAHHRTEPTVGFIFNTRRPLLQDRVLRQALSAAFDAGWINQHLFHGLYKRSRSFFPNAELAADMTRPPEGEERAALEAAKASASLMAAPPVLFDTDGDEETLRANLLAASDLLKKAGYVLKQGKLYAPSGEAVAFEVLLGDPSLEKVALSWRRTLERLGVEVRVRTVDRAQYQARLASFDYEAVVGQWFNSLSPGNEQITFWGCEAARQSGSRNYAGICDPTIDALARAVSAAKTRTALVGAARALDRALLSGFYVVPFFYRGADDMAYSAGLHRPAVVPLYGPILETWWKD